jgi:hypothetical protein
VVVKAFDITAGAYTEVTATVLNGAAAISGDVITLPRLSALETGKVYRVEVQFNAGGNTFECFFEVEGQR